MLVPVQNDVIQRPSLDVQQVRVHRCLPRLLQQTHVISHQPLDERAGFLPLELHDGPVRQVVTREVCGTVSDCFILTVIVHPPPSSTPIT